MIRNIFNYKNRLKLFYLSFFLYLAIIFFFANKIFLMNVFLGGALYLVFLHLLWNGRTNFLKKINKDSSDTEIYARVLMALFFYFMSIFILFQ